MLRTGPNPDRWTQLTESSCLLSWSNEVNLGILLQIKLWQSLQDAWHEAFQYSRKIIELR